MFCTDYFYNNFIVYIYKNIVKLEYKAFTYLYSSSCPLLLISYIILLHYCGASIIVNEPVLIHYH